jgi:hypothetical protein
MRKVVLLVAPLLAVDASSCNWPNIPSARVFGRVPGRFGVSWQLNLVAD